MVDVKSICFTGTRCEKCAHFAVCQFKGDYVKAQADIQFFRKFYSPKTVNIRDAFSDNDCCIDVQLTNSNKMESDE